MRDCSKDRFLFNQPGPKMCGQMEWFCFTATNNAEQTGQRTNRSPQQAPEDFIIVDPTWRGGEINPADTECLKELTCPGSLTEVRPLVWPSFCLFIRVQKCILCNHSNQREEDKGRVPSVPLGVKKKPVMVLRANIEQWPDNEPGPSNTGKPLQSEQSRGKS